MTFMSLGPASLDGVEDTSMTGARILIVDDNDDTTTVARLVLGKDGYDTITARSGEDALNMLASVDVDLVLLDLRLPGIDGIETCARIKAMPDPPVVVMFSVSGFTRDHERATSAGADAYVEKPVPAPDLLRVIGSMLAAGPREPGHAMVVTRA